MTTSMEVAATEPIGLFYTWWRGDPLHTLPLVPDLNMEPVDDPRLLTAMTLLGRQEIDDRMRHGHRAWLASIAGQPAGYGWVATREARIGELGVTLHLPAGNRYLWNFVTHPAWRGRGIYPHLLQTMIAEEIEATRFWIGHDVDNTASARGIIRAGFRSTGTLYRRINGAFVLISEGPVERAAAAAALLNVPLAGTQTD